MSVVKINAITIPEGMGPELERRFAARAGAVDGQPGFEGFQMLRPVAGDTRYFIVTQWDSEESFVQWRDSQAFAGAHGHGAPQGGHAGGHDGGHGGGHGGGHPGGDAPQPPVGMSGDLLEFEVVDLSA